MKNKKLQKIVLKKSNSMNKSKKNIAYLINKCIILLKDNKIFSK